MLLFSFTVVIHVPKKQVIESCITSTGAAIYLKSRCDSRLEKCDVLSSLYFVFGKRKAEIDWSMFRSVVSRYYRNGDIISKEKRSNNFLAIGHDEGR